MTRALLLLLLGFPLLAGAYTQTQGVPQNKGNILLYGADPTGNTDVSAALTAALAASPNYVLIPPGRYLLSGVATVALSNVKINCEGAPANANSPPAYGSTGATFWLTSTSVQPFTVDGGVRINGCNFFWPNQTGLSATPTAYPPLFTEPVGKQMTNFDLLHVRIVNAYDFIGAASTADAFGGISLTDVSGYAIRYFLNLANVPESVVIKGMILDDSLYQAVANAGPNYYLAKWTAANGAFLHVFGNGNGTTLASTVTVQGIFLDNSSVFGYGKFVWVDSTGALAESIFRGVVDAVPRVLQVDSGACVAQLKFDNTVWAYTFNPGAVGQGLGAADNAPAYVINTPASGFNCTSANIDIEGTMNVGQGDVLDITGAYIVQVAMRLAGNGSFANTSTAGTYYYANLNASNLSIDLSGNHVQPKTAGSTARGINIQSAYQVTVNGNKFNGVYNPIALGTSTIPVVGAGNLSTASPVGSNGVVGTGTFAHNLLSNGNYWDLLTAVPVVSACGTGPASTGDDMRGSIAFGTGTVTACTLTFANAYAGTPRCSFATTIIGGTPLVLSAISASAITLSAGATNMAGAQAYYQCQP